MSKVRAVNNTFISYLARFCRLHAVLIMCPSMHAQLQTTRAQGNRDAEVVLIWTHNVQGYFLQNLTV